MWEWVQDFYGTTFYYGCTSTCIDPLNTTNSGYRVVRGGSFHHSSPACLRAVYRYLYDPAERTGVIGFRCRRDVP